ncbi:MAG: heme biosynthesis HemY N-terminal domain-containing protein [Mariprofundaceae bacterium]
MRLTLLLLLSLILALALIAFPHLADQPLRIEAFGWLFETRQGAFIVALLALLFVLWLMRAIVRALLAGPGQAWEVLRLGNRRRREARLREALTHWVDGRGDGAVRKLRRTRGIVPKWLLALLRTLMTPAHELPPPSREADPIETALAARIATDPAAHPRPDPALRRRFLEAWLEAHPGAPLALVRLADVAEEEGDWPRAAELLEDIWKRGIASGSSVKPRLARAWLHMARAAEDREQAAGWLRKAFRLAAEDPAIVLAWGEMLTEKGDEAAARKLWLDWLARHPDMAVARALLAQLGAADDGGEETAKATALRQYRKLERREGSAAFRWLRAELAHRAGLEGIAGEQMRALAEDAQVDAQVRQSAWCNLGEWRLAAGDAGEAAACFRRALAIGQPACYK